MDDLPPWLDMIIEFPGRGRTLFRADPIYITPEAGAETPLAPLSSLCNQTVQSEDSSRREKQIRFVHENVHTTEEMSEGEGIRIAMTIAGVGEW